MIKSLLLLSVILYLPITSFADGNKLLAGCQGFIKILEGKASESGGVAEGFCAGYVQGMSDLNTIHSVFYAGKVKFDICMPQNVNNAQRVRVLIKYLEENPEKLHESEAELVWQAYAKAFPCK